MTTVAQPLPLHLPACTVRQHDAEMAGAVRVRSPLARKVAAEYLRESDPDMLAFLTDMAKTFGPAAEIALDGYAGLRERLEAASKAAGQAGIAAARRALESAA